MACKDPERTPYPKRWRMSRAVPLAFEFELIREKVGGVPIITGSAFRTRSWNVKKKGARLSQHVEGRGLDLYPPGGMTNVELLNTILAIASRPDSRLRGIGFYPWGVHIDNRNSERIARWRGSRPQAEVVPRAT